MNKFKPQQLADELAAELHNSYGFSLDWQKMVPLVKEALPTIEAFVQDIEQFVAFLGMIAGSHTGPD